MLSTDDLCFFVTVATSVSLAAAARALGVTPPAVTQRLRQLETRLGVRLVDRSTKQLSLTDEGELLVARGRVVIREVENITETLASRTGVVKGHLRVAAPFGFGRRYVAAAAAQFRASYPAATLTLELSEKPARLRTDSWDIIVHVGALADSSLIVRKLAPNERVACASSDYIARRGHPKRPEDLPSHDCVVLRENDEDVTLWRFSRPGEKPVSVRIHPVMASNDGTVAHDWALAGAGIILRSEWDVAAELRSGRLVRVLPDWKLATADVVALLGTRHGRAARTTRFLEILHDVLTPPPWRL